MNSSKNSILYAILGLLCLLGLTNANQCKTPNPAQNFTLEGYSGVWYEIAKFQTAGGAFFESSCVCTQLNVTIGADASYKVDNICRDNTPTGKIIDAVGTLYDEDSQYPGRFQETFFFLAPSVTYTILFLGNFTNSDGNIEEYSVEYDCGDNFLTGLNYCVHFLSRNSVMSQELLTYLINEVNALNLNSENLALKVTTQNGCWSS